jgi:hypothetical protein
MLALKNGRLNVAKFLVELGANLFLEDVYDIRAIDIICEYTDDNLGPQVLEHAQNLRWNSVKQFLLLSKACQSSRRFTAEVALDDDVNTLLLCFKSARLVASVLGSPDLASKIASFLVRSNIIVCDPLIPRPPDAIKARVEAEIELSRKRARDA